MTRESDLDFELPHDAEAERLILGSIFTGSTTDPEYFAKVAEHLDEDRFYVEKHQILFSVLRHCFDNGTVHVAIAKSELERRNQLQKFGSIDDFLDVTEVSNLESYCNVVNESYRLRKMYHSFGVLRDRVLNRDDSDLILAEAQQLIAKVESSLPQDDSPTPAEIVDRCGGVKPFLFPEKSSGIMTPYRRFNETTNGLKLGRYSVLGGKPGTGKTSFACGVSLAVAINGHRVKYNSHEMLKEDVLRRMAYAMAGVDSRKAESGHLDREETFQSIRSLEEICSLGNLRISDKGNRTVAAIRRDCRKQISSGEPNEIIVVDYMQKMHAVGRFERRQLELASISNGLQETAHDFNAHVLALSQLSVDAKEQYDKEPTEDDYREAKDIGQDIDLGMILRLRDAEQRYQSNRMVNMYLVKNRFGPLGVIPYIFESVATRFREIPRELTEAEAA